MKKEFKVYYNPDKDEIIIVFMPKGEFFGQCWTKDMPIGGGMGIYKKQLKKFTLLGYLSDQSFII